MEFILALEAGLMGSLQEWLCVDIILAASTRDDLARAGTFLYVAFMEVIPKEMATPEYGLSKLGVLILGFGAMSLLAIWA